MLTAYCHLTHGHIHNNEPDRLRLHFIGSRLALEQHDNKFTSNIDLQRSVYIIGFGIKSIIFLFFSYGVMIINGPDWSRSWSCIWYQLLAKCSFIAITLKRKWQLSMQWMRKKLIKMLRFGFQKTNIHHGPLARYAKSRVRMRRECRERFPHHRR